MLNLYFPRAAERARSVRAVAAFICATVLAAMVPMIAGPATVAHATATTYTQFNPGAAWLDQNSHALQMHGLGIVADPTVANTWYAVGEDKTGENAQNTSFQNVTCYKSTDLMNWTYQNEALTQSTTINDLKATDLTTAPAVGTVGHTEHIIERPKIIYDKANSTYVMFMHVDTGYWTGGSYSYQDGAVGWATSPSNKPCGPYTYQGRLAWPTTPAGATYRSFDMNVFQDSDGTTYLLGEDNGWRLKDASTNSYYPHDSSLDGLKVYKLALGKDSNGSETVTIASEVAQLNQDYESPAVMMTSNGSATTYYILASPKNGWSPTDNQYASLTTTTGQDLGQLLTASSTNLSSMAWHSFAPVNTHTYQTQTANVIPVKGSSGTTYILAADRWTTGDLGSSPLVWLPITHHEGNSANVLNVGWFNGWTLDIANGTWTAKSSLPSGTTLKSANSPSTTSLMMDVQYGWTNDNQPIDQYQSNGNLNQKWNLNLQAGNTYTLTSANATTECLDRQLSPNQLVQYTCHSSASSAPWAEWIFDAVGSKYDGNQTYTTFELKNLDSGLVVDVPGQSQNNSVILDLASDSGLLSQQWTVS